MSDLWRRVLTALVLIPIALGAVVIGGWVFAALVALVAGRAQWELYAMGERAGLNVARIPALFVGLLVVLVPMWPQALPAAFLGMLVLLVLELYRRSEQPLAVAALAVFGLFYPVMLAAWILHLRVEPVAALGDAWAIWLVVGALVSVWAADTMAYFAGRALGRRPLFERVSPKKTIEGTVGGVFGAVAATVLLWVVVPEATAWPSETGISWVHAVAVGLIAGIVGPYGDLVESLFKRSVDVKDSGDFLPGHGGMLDRIDAMILAVPVMVLYLRYVADLF